MLSTLDTIHFSFSTDFIESMDNEKFNVCEIKTAKGLIIKNYFLKQKKLGLEKLSINEQSKKVTVKVSSKILGTNYPLGISNVTLEQFICELNKSGITLNKSFINDVTVSFVDVKSDLKLIREHKDYFNSLNHLAALGFAKTQYPTGISFNENIESTPVRITFYDKDYEMGKEKTFYKTNPELIKIFDDILRIESRFAGKATIRKHFGSCNLLDILNSKNINYNIFNMIVNDQKFDIVFDIKNLTQKEEKNLGQILLLYEHYNGNLNEIINHIKSKLSKNTKATYQIKNAKKYFYIIEGMKDNFLKENIEEIKNALFNQP